MDSPRSSQPAQSSERVLRQNLHYYDLGDQPRAAVEDANDYREGGFHPVVIGDLLGECGRFRVVDKLGDGGCGTVWLCRDQAENKWRAVKILSAHMSHNCRDIIAIDHFTSMGIGREQREENHVFLPLDHFWIKGPNGDHLCHVLPLLGPSLRVLMDTYRDNEALLKDISFQLVEAMDFIHSADICHGDFRAENILLRLSDEIDDMTEADLREKLGMGDRETTSVVIADCDEADRDPGVPDYLVSKVEVDISSGFCLPKVAVVDFGMAYRAENCPTNHTGIPFHYAAPEDMFLQVEHGFEADIWTLACTIYEIHTEYLPFTEDGEVSEAVRNMETEIGPLPRRYREAYQESLGPLSKNEVEIPDDLPVSITTQNIERTKKDMMDAKHTDRLLVAGMVGEVPLRRLKQTTDATGGVEDYKVSGRIPPFYPSYREMCETQHDPRELVSARMSLSAANKLADFLMTIFKWDPLERASTGDLLNHEWFEDHRTRLGLLDSRRKAHWGSRSVSNIKSISSSSSSSSSENSRDENDSSFVDTLALSISTTPNSPSNVQRSRDDEELKTIPEEEDNSDSSNGDEITRSASPRPKEDQDDEQATTIPEEGKKEMDDSNANTPVPEEEERAEADCDSNALRDATPQDQTDGDEQASPAPEEPQLEDDSNPNSPRDLTVQNQINGEERDLEAGTEPVEPPKTRFWSRLPRPRFLTRAIGWLVSLVKKVWKS